MMSDADSVRNVMLNKNFIVILLLILAQKYKKILTKDDEDSKTLNFKP